MRIPNTEVIKGKLYRHHIFSHQLYIPQQIEEKNVKCLYNKDADFSTHRWDIFTHEVVIHISKFLSGEYVKTFKKQDHILYQSFDNFNVAGSIVVFQNGKGIINHLPLMYWENKDEHTCFEFTLDRNDVIGLKLKYTLFGEFRYNSDHLNAINILKQNVKTDFKPVNYNLEQFKRTYTTGILLSETRDFNPNNTKVEKLIILPQDHKSYVQKSLF